jgi:hypothetical protein
MFTDIPMVQDPFHTIVLPLTRRYTEISWFADKNVYTTKEAATAVQGDLTHSWTHRLSQEQNLLGQPFIILPDTGGRYVELERTLSSIVFYHWFLDGSEAAYKKLSSVQNPNEKLTWDSFQEIHQLAKKTASTLDFQNALESMLIFSDAGKTPTAIARAQSSGVRQADHDDFIAALFNRPPIHK